MRRAAAVTVLASGFVLGCGAPPRVVRTYAGEYRDPTAPPAASPTPIILIPPPVVVH